MDKVGSHREGTNMTRQQQKKVREVNAVLNREIRSACKRYKYKTVMGFAYKVVNGYLYTLCISVPPVGVGDYLGIRLWCKPLAMDEMFWEVFGMKEIAANQPFSFHRTAAFAPYDLTLEKWDSPLESIEKMTETLDGIFRKGEKLIDSYVQDFQDIEDYKQCFVKLENNCFPLNVILCDMVQGEYQAALDRINEEIAAGKRGGFASVKGGDIFSYAKKYCEKKLDVS